jgi:antitoxin (DNA-binding transcriptional repressor) of toxin-antitoxin stability system
MRRFVVGTVNMRELSRNTKSVVEEVVRSGRPAIVMVNGRPQAAVTPLIGALEAAEEHLLRNAPAHIQSAIREGEADLIAGKVSVADDSIFEEAAEEEHRSLDEIAATLADRVDTGQLVDAIRSAADDPEAVTAVREALAQGDVFAIGRVSGDLSAPGRGTESDIVTYADEEQGGVLLPVFTRLEIMRSALLRNPAWQSLDVLQVKGKELVHTVDSDVTIIIDPASEQEFRVPPSDRRTVVTEQPIVAAAEIVGA